MNASHEPSDSVQSSPALIARRAELQRQLHDRRQQIALALQGSALANTDFPRSRTMQFFSNNPVLAAAVLAVVVSTVTRTRLSRIIPSALMLTRLLHGLATRSSAPSAQQRRRHSADEFAD